MKKRDFLFIYSNQWNVPNGDPFSGEQRYDASTGKVLVSDVRIKRFIRDKMIEMLEGVDPVFVQFDTVLASGLSGMTGAALSFRKFLLEKGIISKIDEKFKNIDTPLEELFKQFIDVRLFGGLVTIKDINLSVEGAVQFKNLSSSLNRVKMETIQNTTVFPSDVKNTQGSIGTSSIVPYCIIPVEGWLNEESARLNGLSEEDIEKMLSMLWLGVRDKNTRSKTSQTPVVLLEVIYKGQPYKYNPNKTVYKKIHNLDRLVTITTDLREEEIRSDYDFSLNFDHLFEQAKGDHVEEVRFFLKMKQ